jgi:hypothetical protein
MHEIDQILPTSRSLRKGWIGCENFDREVDFVDDSLAGSVATVEQFEVFDSVVRSQTVDVMDSLFGEQISSYVFGHDVAVLEHLVFFAGDKAGNRDPDVAMSLDMLADVAAFKFGERFCSLVRSFALRIAVFLLFVYATARLATFRIRIAACEASKSVPRFACLATSNARTLARTVHRAAFVFLFVRVHEGLHHRECLAAFAASEVHVVASFRRNSFTEAVGASTRKSTILPAFVAFVAGKRLLAVLTEFLNRHQLVPLFGNTGILLLSIEEVK